MSFKDLMDRARAEKPDPVRIEVSAAGELFQIEVSRLPGMDWSGIMVECPPRKKELSGLGCDLPTAALLACERYGRLFDAAGVEIPDVVWEDLFEVLSGTEVQGVAATWWTLNMRDPNQKVVELKKASAAGSETSSS